jgi:formylglycine-generating enzyme
MPHASLHIFDKTAELKRLSEMIFVEGGTFLMGDGEMNWDDTKRIIHPVKLNSFYIGKYPVTQALWKAVMNGENPSYFQGDNLPVERVSWYNSRSFVQDLNAQTGQKFRLPTEAEWEYAARGGKYWADFPFIYSGSNKLNEVGWYDWNSHIGTKPVGLKTPNFLDIHDMSGNVWEWCHDWYGSYEAVIKQAVKDSETDAILNPFGIVESDTHVLRGCDWNYYASYCRSASRNGNAPSGRIISMGFRLVLLHPSV